MFFKPTLCMLVIAFAALLIFGYLPSLYWLNLVYYAFCAFVIVEAIGLILSVLTMLWRDVKKLVTSLTRMLFYFTPLIWNCHFNSNVPFHTVLNAIMKLNPFYYIVNGYRDRCFIKKTFGTIRR